MVLYEKLYSMDMSDHKVASIKRKMKKMKAMDDLYLIVIPERSDFVLEYYAFNEFLKPQIRQYYSNNIIIGIAIGEEEAIQLTAKILTAVYRESGGFDVRTYIGYE